MKGGTPPRKGYFYFLFPFLGKDARSEQLLRQDQTRGFCLPWVGDGDPRAPRAGGFGTRLGRRMEKQRWHRAAPAPSTAALGLDPQPPLGVGCGGFFGTTHPQGPSGPPKPDTTWCNPFPLQPFNDRSPFLRQLFPQVPLNANRSRPHHVRRGNHRPGL